MRPLLFILLSSFCFAGCENEIQKVKIFAEGEALPETSGKNIQIIYSDSAKVKVKITAPLLNRYIESKNMMEMPEGVEVLFYNDSLNVISSFYKP